MHELPVIKNILDICMKHAAANNARQILSVSLEVGELSDVEDIWIQRYFDYLSKNTIAEGARLNIQRIPFVMECRDCGAPLQVDIRKNTTNIKCPECGNDKFKYVSGKGYRIENMEIV